MSWSMDLTANRKIPVQSVEIALQKLDNPRLNLHIRRMDWGWSSVVDVNLPKGRVLTLSGAGFSLVEADAFASALAAQLRKLKFRIQVGPIRD